MYGQEKKNLGVRLWFLEDVRFRMGARVSQPKSVCSVLLRMFGLTPFPWQLL